MAQTEQLNTSSLQYRPHALFNLARKATITPVNSLNTHPRESGTYTVTQITELIKTLLESSFTTVAVKGELSGVKPSPSGHLYFSLKDETSQISSVMFRGTASSLTFTPRDGMLVVAKGRISVYPPRGGYQLVVSSMTQAGEGNIMEAIERLKRKLAGEELFDTERKKALPPFPRTVGVVTSPTGAALRDILNIRRRRNPKVDVVIFPALVQGEGAARSIVSMIQAADRYKLCDVLIVGRGGGSLEDLLAFSDESVVRAVAACRTPVVSAVGHEIDWALCDFAADVRAPTPSAAAEITIPELAAIEDTIATYQRELVQATQSRLSSLRLVLKTFDPENMRARLQSIEQQLSQRFDMAFEAMQQGVTALIKDRRAQVELCVRTLESCSPQAVLSRGYSVVTDESGRVIRDAGQLTLGQRITVRPATGQIAARVEEVTP